MQLFFRETGTLGSLPVKAEQDVLSFVEEKYNSKVNVDISHWFLKNTLAIDEFCTGDPAWENKNPFEVLFYCCDLRNWGSSDCVIH